MALEPTTEDTSPIDYRKAVKDYSLLISMLKWGAVIALMLGFLVMILLAN
ncbi:hypothetical protein [Sphingomonas astaxanthinifaciens]|uniref:Aa3 type cytochrome c oxidase subunit IV n=1 Tax=Sphingomonas astaxanthinifaciens DSM 22298 TaxID=1123267 RepID=A0ABQ5Z7R2_9SPHN|nr:hypothetical protein [Sphingomonas astaxanthinifaciens]GLR47989.1 hypothetical protein GCM10007925_17020 [Sphingomonas astaxanthinifaciens DSM 22298]